MHYMSLYDIKITYVLLSGKESLIEKTKLSNYTVIGLVDL